MPCSCDAEPLPKVYISSSVELGWLQSLQVLERGMRDLDKSSFLLLVQIQRGFRGMALSKVSMTDEPKSCKRENTSTHSFTGLLSFCIEM